MLLKVSARQIPIEYVHNSLQDLLAHAYSHTTWLASYRITKSQQVKHIEILNVVVKQLIKPHTISFSQSFKLKAFNVLKLYWYKKELHNIIIYNVFRSV
jgi:hypothetical protein